MSGLSLYGRDQQLGAFFTPDQYATPEEVWVALCTVIPTPGDTGTDLVEPLDEAYHRISYPLSSQWWVNTGRNAMTNTDEIVFEPPGEDWGEIVGWALCTDSAGGLTFYVGELEEPVRFIYDAAVSRLPTLGAGSIVAKQT